MVAENFLQALQQAMSPKAHDAIDNAMSSNNRMKFQEGGSVSGGLYNLLNQAFGTQF